MSWEEVCHFIAQGAVNIAEGHNTIEPGSLVHQAMGEFCKYVSEGHVQCRIGRPGAIRKQAKERKKDV